MDAIILAGGLGTRLRETVAHVPKPLAPIRGEPFLDILLKQLEASKLITRIILAISFEAEKIITRYSQRASLLFSREEVPLGTGGGLKKALRLAVSEEVWVLNGDSFLELDFSQMAHFHRAQGADCTLAGLQVEDVSRYGSIFADEKNRIIAFQEKGKAGVGLMSAGIYLLKKNLLEGILGDNFSLEKEGFPALLNKPLFVYPHTGKFIDIGTKESYYLAQKIL